MFGGTELREGRDGYLRARWFRFATAGLLTPWRASRVARAFDIAHAQIGHAAGTWPFAGQCDRPK